MGLQRHQPPAHPDLGNRRLLVPVLAPTGGSGRSVVAALLAQAHAPQHRTVVLDAGHPAASPWPSWLTRPAPAPVPTGTDPVPQELFAACSTMRAPDAATVQVLTPATAAPTGHHPLPIPAGACQRFAAVLGHPVVVVDTDTDLLRAPPHHHPRPGGDDETGAGFWLQHRDAGPVLCVAASPKGVADAAVVVTALEQTGTASHRLTVAVVGIAGTDLPRRVLAGLMLLQERVHAIVRVGHDPRIRATGRPVLDRAPKPVRREIAELTDAVTTAATHPPTHPPTPPPTHRQVTLPAGRAGAELRSDVGTGHTPGLSPTPLEKGHP